MRRLHAPVAATALLVAALGHVDGEAVQNPTVVWRLDNLSRIGGQPVKVLGDPRLVSTGLGDAIAFDGADDGLFVELNPLQGLARFTVEVVFQPAPGGPEEQRFLHFEEPVAASRALIELRMRPDSHWALDTFLRSNEKGLTLLDRERLHPAGRWHVAALTYDGRTMRHYVNGRLELHGDIAFAAMGAGRTSIGVRQTKVSWFKGVIHSIRITPEALPQNRLMPAPSAAPQRLVIPLWPEGVPDAKPGGGSERLVDGRVYNVHSPTLTLVPPRPQPNGTGVIICPGGSYERLAVANEAEGVAAKLADVGVTSFILKYRLKEYGHPAPLQDVLRAVRLLRARAADFGIAANRIGVFGASAGGHLAVAAATLFDSPDGRTGASLNGVSGRPDFAALLYPVITMDGPAAHGQSRRNLLGPGPGPAQVRALSLEHHVRHDTPPLFIVHTAEDRSVPVENSLLLYAAARRAGVAAELHLYDRGPHGFGTRTDVGPAAGWTDRFTDWLRASGFLASPAEIKPCPSATCGGR